MNAYDPLKPPNAKEWLALDEIERVEKCRPITDATRFACRTRLHALMHVIVENQLAMPEAPVVRATLERLMAEGLDRHDAIHAIASVLTEQMWHVMKGEAPQDENVGQAYYRELEKLTAAKWLASGV
jgi:hypothetical protein